MAACPSSGAICEEGKNALEARRAATPLQLARKVNVCLRECRKRVFPSLNGPFEVKTHVERTRTAGLASDPAVRGSGVKTIAAAFHVSWHRDVSVSRLFELAR